MNSVTDSLTTPGNSGDINELALMLSLEREFFHFLPVDWARLYRARPFFSYKLTESVVPLGGEARNRRRGPPIRIARYPV